MRVALGRQHIASATNSSFSFSCISNSSFSICPPQITINQEAGSLLICLLKTCLHAVSLCLEGMASASPPELKLIEEILHYLTRLINYAPAECVACLRQLLKYLFAQNYASQVRLQPSAGIGGNGSEIGHHAAFMRPYFAAKGRGHGASSTLLPTINSKPAVAVGSQRGAPTDARQPIDAGPLQDMGMLFVHGLQPPTPPAGDCVRLIKLFEPMVIYCLTVSTLREAYLSFRLHFKCMYK